MAADRIKGIAAIGLDLGNTLMTYDGVPLSWEAGYAAALTAMADHLGETLDEETLSRACDRLRLYNTRIHPREEEVPADVIFRDVLAAAGLNCGGGLNAAVVTFFDCFRQNFLIYDDALPFLRDARTARLPVGILTDVPYGMPRCLVERDVRPFEGLLDVVLSSEQVGWRKPRPEGFHGLSAALGVQPDAMVYIGDEAKDISGAHAAGMTAILLDRRGGMAGAGEDARVGSLREAAAMLGMITNN